MINLCPCAAERAAIFEIDGSMSREEADAEALELWERFGPWCDGCPYEGAQE